MDSLARAIIVSLSAARVEDLAISGDISEGTFSISFGRTADAEPFTDDSLDAVGLVVRALNAGRVSAPGWPDDAVIDEAIATVKIRHFGLVPAT